MNITVVEDECPFGTEDVFERLWLGTVRGCDARESEISERYQVMTEEGYQERHR